MDRALKKCTNWEPDNGYGVIPNKIFRNKWVKPRSIKIKSPKLIKLHGATNWITSHIMTDGNGNLQHSHDASPSSLFIFKAYPCYKGRYMDGYQPFSYGYYPPNLFKIGGRKASEGFSCVQVTTKYPWQKTGISANNGLVSMPLIIPSVKEKQYNFYGELFDILWNEAENLLVEAHHLIIIGYSLPATDIQSSTLFIKAFMRRKDIPKITIIDPSPELIMDKLKFEFGIPSSNIEVFNTKFSDDFDFERIKFEE